MKEPTWVDDKEIEAISMMVVAQFGGDSSGIRDENLFKAATARALNKWHYSEVQPGLYTLAAAYCFGICRGHVFFDGNKRTAYTVAVVFLSLNGIECSPDQADIVSTILALGMDDISEDDLAEWFRANSKVISGED